MRKSLCLMLAGLWSISGLISPSAFARSSCDSSELNVVFEPIPDRVVTGNQIWFHIVSTKRDPITRVALIVNDASQRVYEKNEAPSLVSRQARMKVELAIDLDLPNSIKLRQGGNRLSVQVQDKAGRCFQSETQTLVAGGPNVYAVLVGINHYNQFQQDLRFARDDAVAVREHLEKRRFVDPRHIFLLADDPRQAQDPNAPPVSDIPDRIDPTKDNFLEALEKIAKVADTSSTLLIYMSQHGYYKADAPNGRDKQYFVFQESDTDKYWHMLSRTDFTTALAGIASQLKIILLDSCYSGFVDAPLGVVGPKTMPGVKAISNSKGATDEGPTVLSGAFTISSSKKNQVSWEYPELRHGLFTFMLLQAADKLKASEDNRIEIGDVYTYVDKSIARWLIDQKKGVIQTPDQNLIGDASKFVWAYK